MQRERDAAARAVVLAFAIARVLDVLVAIFRVQGDEADAVGKEFVGEDRGVFFYLDKVDGDGWDFGEHYSAQRVGEGKVDGAEFEVNAVGFGLTG